MTSIMLIELIKMNVNKWILVLYLTVLVGSIYTDGLSTATNERGMYFKLHDQHLIKLYTFMHLLISFNILSVKFTTDYSV